MEIISLHKTISTSKILLLYTGGTFGMKQNPCTGANEPFPLDQIATIVPELLDCEANLDWAVVPEIKDSSSIGPEDWVLFAQLLKSQKHNYQSFVVIHGTDTMAFTASALSFLLIDLEQIIVVTGAQKSIHVADTDAKRNLLNSIKIAEDHALGKIKLPEVCICFGDVLLRANRSKKVDNNGFNAFKSYNYPALASINDEIIYNQNSFLVKVKRASRHLMSLSSRVALLKYYPGISSQIVGAYLDEINFDAVLIESFGSGNLPLNETLKEKIENFHQKGGKVFLLTQSLKGGIEQSSYQTGSWLKELGVQSLNDMTAEAALTKAMFLISKSALIDMTHDYCGEITIS